MHSVGLVFPLHSRLASECPHTLFINTIETQVPSNQEAILHRLVLAITARLLPLVVLGGIFVNQTGRP